MSGDTGRNWKYSCAAIPMEGSGGIRARFGLRGEWAARDNAMLIATLKNGRADYEHG